MQSVILKKDVLIQDYKIEGLTCVSRSLIHLVPLPFFQMITGLVQPTEIVQRQMTGRSSLV